MWEAWGSYGLGMVTALKTAKNCILRDMAFLISYHIWLSFYATFGNASKMLVILKVGM